MLQQSYNNGKMCIRDRLNAIDSCSADINKIITSYGVKINWYDYNTFNNDIDSLPLKK